MATQSSEEPWSARLERETREALERRYKCHGCKQTGQGSYFYIGHWAECPTPPAENIPEMEVLA